MWPYICTVLCLFAHQNMHVSDKRPSAKKTCSMNIVDYRLLSVFLHQSFMPLHRFSSPASAMPTPHPDSFASSFATRPVQTCSIATRSSRALKKPVFLNLKLHTLVIHKSSNLKLQTAPLPISINIHQYSQTRFRPLCPPHL